MAPLSGGAFILAGWTHDPFSKCVAFLLAAVGIQFRLLCNLFDGMVAVEGGFRTKSGELFNELPDRFADAFIIAGSGYSFGSPQWLPELAWCTAVLAVIVAYVRALGASMGTGQSFLGPMAKQHRMAVMTFAAVTNSICIFFTSSSLIIVSALVIIVTGASITIWKRCRNIIRIAEAQ